MQTKITADVQVIFVFFIEKNLSFKVKLHMCIKVGWQNDIFCTRLLIEKKLLFAILNLLDFFNNLFDSYYKKRAYIYIFFLMQLVITDRTINNILYD